MNARQFLILTLSCMVMLPASAKNNSGTILDLKESITDNAIVYPESFEADIQKLLESWYLKNYTATDNRYANSQPVKADDQTIIKRLSALPTKIELPFNQVVRSYIERYTERGRAQVGAILGLNLYYEPIFEQALEARGLPLELKYLPVIESALNPNAVSRHGATGLWQFMLGTAKGLGMEVNSLVDERRDPYVSSEKAAGYLADLYSAYGDWSLAIAAYNCGPGTVNKAIRRAGGDASAKDFWSIYNYLPAETRGYVPMFIAANYVMNYYPEHNISAVLPTKPLITDTVRISNRVHFNQISKVLDIPVDELRILNPQFRADLIPGSMEHPYNLILPSQQIHAYIMSEDDILAYEAEKYARREVVEPGGLSSDATALADENNTDNSPAVEDDQSFLTAATPDRSDADQDVATVRDSSQAAASSGRQTTITHKVAAGESLADIARKYGVTVSQIKVANNLRRNAVRIGQQLRITTTEAAASAAGVQTADVSRSDNAKASSSRKASSKSKAKAKKSKSSAPKTTYHKLKSGDNLSSLSKRYGVSINDIKRANNMKSDKLRAGETIKIPSKSSKSRKGRR